MTRLWLVLGACTILVSLGSAQAQSTNGPLTPPFNVPPAVAPPRNTTPQPAPTPNPAPPVRPIDVLPPININPRPFVYNYVPAIYYGYDPYYGYYPYSPPFAMVAPGGSLPVLPPLEPPGSGIVAAPPPQFFLPSRPSQPARQRAPRRDPARAAELITFGDRLFRADNLTRASERYAQAVQADPQAAAPRVRQAQVAVRRGRYADAAARLRDATTVEPGWLAQAPNLKALYAEPSDVAKTIAALEAHLQAQPDDRDAWLVLGAQKFLSGQTQEAADVFLRLHDRDPDATLKAFLSATKR